MFILNLLNLVFELIYVLDAGSNDVRSGMTHYLLITLLKLFLGSFFRQYFFYK